MDESTESDHLTNLIGQAAAFFRETFGSEPETISIAPGRVNLIGEHTDYHEGFVLPAAIDRYVIVAARKANGFRFVSQASGDSGHAEDPQALPKWARYAASPAILRPDAPGIQATIRSTLPIGAGLSSSAAIEVAFAGVWNAWMGKDLDRFEIARFAQRCENEALGVPSGLMDQLASACGVEGAALLIDLRNPEALAPVSIPRGLSIAILDSGERHDLGESGYPRRRRESERAAAKLGVRVLRDASPDQVEASKDLTDVERRRARHVVTENARVLAFVEALRVADEPTLGRLMQESHESMRLDYEITTPLLDRIVEECRRDESCVGARMTGGGFGGSAVALVHQERENEFLDRLGEFLKRNAGPDAKAFVCRASRGAYLVDWANRE